MSQLQIPRDELITNLVAHGISVNPKTGLTTAPVAIEQLGRMIAFMLNNEVNGNGMAKDMALLIARMAPRLREKDGALAIKATDYLKRRGLMASPFHGNDIEQVAIVDENPQNQPETDRREPLYLIPALRTMSAEQLEKALQTTTRMPKQ